MNITRALKGDSERERDRERLNESYIKYRLKKNEKNMHNCIVEQRASK